MKRTHGGARPGAGRPPVPDAERLSAVYTIRLTAADAELLKQSEARSWARDTLVRAAKRRLQRG